jgi:hypothetical protein
MLVPPVAGVPRGTVRIRGANLLTVAVTVVAVIDAREHDRRRLSGSGAFTDPALLNLLLGLPLGMAVTDPVAWAETSDQPESVIARDPGSVTVTRHLRPPLLIEDVIITSVAGRELRAVHDASLFARYARRWVAAASGRVSEAVVLEAKICGVGIVDRSGAVVLDAEPPRSAVLDAWDWMLREKAYRRWISRPSQAGATASLARATGEATA